MKQDAQQNLQDVDDADDQDEWLEDDLSAMKRIMMLEDEVKLLKAALYAMPAALEKEKMEIRKSLEEFKNLQTRLTDISSITAQSNQKVETLGRLIEVTKRETSSWLVVSIVGFSIFFIISLFIRAG